MPSHRALLFASLLIGLATSSTGISAELSAPHLFFILTDDQRHDALGVMNGTLQTPNMDRLAKEGVRFSNAFVTTSLCSPSRATILTGLPMRLHGVVDNNSTLPRELETFPLALQKAGYETAFFGKWHMGGEDASPRPGFDHWVSFPGQGSYGPTTLFGTPSMLNVNGEEVPQQGYITDELTNHVLTWLEQRSNPEKPMLVYLSHKAVHAPFKPAERHTAAYSDVVMPSIVPDDAAMQREPLWVQMQRNSWHGVDFPYHSALDLDTFRRDYRRTLNAVDDSLGRILAWIEAHDTGRETIVVFTSDNGFLFGEHGLIDKRNAYESSIRVPLLVWSTERIRGGRVDERLVSTLDIAPTLRALAGASPQNLGEGRDLTPALLGRVDDTPEDISLIYEYYWEFNYPHTPSMFAIRNRQYKLIRHHGVWDTDALYDLSVDPEEQNNLIADPEFESIRLALAQELHQRLAAQGAQHSIPYTYKYNQGAVFRNTMATEAPLIFPERWQRLPDAPDRYEHFLPDGPGKSQRLEILNSALERTLDQ